MKQGIVREHYDLLRLVVDHGAYPVLIVDQANVIQMTNPAADRLLRQPASELVGRLFPFPIEGRRVHEARHVRADDGSWSAEMSVERTDLEGRRLYVVSLRDLSERVLLNGVLEETRLTDDLTGLLNARGFNVLAEQQLKLARRNGRGFIFMLVDVDDMAALNKRLGRPAGDLMLKELGDLMRRTYRDSDIVARVDGDQFALAALEAGRDSGGILVARLRDHLWEYNAGAPEGGVISVSTGVARYNDAKSPGVGELLASARDELLVNKRERGRLSNSA